MGEAEWLPSSAERDTEISEVERAKREQDRQAREVSETPEVSRRRRGLWPEIVECYRKLLRWTQSEVPLFRHFFAHALQAPPATPVGHAQRATSRLGLEERIRQVSVRWQSRGRGSRLRSSALWCTVDSAKGKILVRG